MRPENTRPASRYRARSARSNRPSSGPRVRAMAHALHYLHGVPVRKTPAIIAELTGVRLTQGAITQDAMKQGERAVGAMRRYIWRSIRCCKRPHRTHLLPALLLCSSATPFSKLHGLALTRLSGPFRASITPKCCLLSGVQLW